MMGLLELSLTRMPHSLDISPGCFSEQIHQDDPSSPRQTPGTGMSELAEGRGLGHCCSGDAAHGAFSATVHGSLFWKAQQDLEGNGAGLALPLPPDGSPDEGAAGLP